MQTGESVSSCTPSAGCEDTYEHKSSCSSQLWSSLRRHKKSVAVICIMCVLVALSHSVVKCTPSSVDGCIVSGKIRRAFGFHTPMNSRLSETLRNAATTSKTVIITTLNKGWADGNNSMIDLFLESFRRGEGTESLLRHLVIVALDERAFNRCMDIHPHCYRLITHGVDFSEEKAFMSADYLKMMWRRIQFLGTVLEEGYSFIFTDADVLWIRNPFPHFLPDKDFQIACDQFNGHPTDLHNLPNGGFVYVRASRRTVRFYRYWYTSGLSYPASHDQSVLNKIKFTKSFEATGVKIRFLDTQFFGGFCAIGRSNFRIVTTMHANCCRGVKAKIVDLRAILDGWIQFRSDNISQTFKAPVQCPKSWRR